MRWPAPNFYAGQYEFQCLHGMGEPLYNQIVGVERFHRPCRVYAPVGSHDTLLAYLVRRLLENGANTSFVNRIADPDGSGRGADRGPGRRGAGVFPVGAPHPRIAQPRDLFAPERPIPPASISATNCGWPNSARRWQRARRPARRRGKGRARRAVRNPADQRDIVGPFLDADLAEVGAACAGAAAAGPPGRDFRPPSAARSGPRRLSVRGACAALAGLICREAGKTLPNAHRRRARGGRFPALLRRRGFARRFDNATHRPLGLVVCISPWNFPIAIFTGQIAAALAAGNGVIAKPAEETPLIAAEAVRLMHEAGVPACADGSSSATARSAPCSLRSRASPA